MKKITCLLLLVSFFACNPNRIYNEYEGIPGMVWESSNKLNFEVEIEDTISTHKLIIAISHGTYYIFNNLIINVTTTTPSGRQNEKRYELQLKDENGDWKALGAGDYWDIEIQVEEGIRFYETGTYKFEIEQLVADQLPMVMEVGLIIEKEDCSPDC
ncbi:MAG: gliding motility lipoprotein GldH [Cytophagales bacterium]|nr:gliding motility lipoprotein GldH [Cytophagales bacterium]